MKLAIMLALCSVAFLAGRLWPQEDRTPAGAGPSATQGARTGGPAGRSGPRRVRPPVGPKPRPRIAATAAASAGTADDPYMAAWRVDRVGAERVRLAVLETMEARRRAANDLLRACLRDAGVHGLVKLRFAVAVASTTSDLRVGEAVLREVVEGQPVPDAAAGCLEGDLDGDEVVASDEHGAFLHGYTGDIDYVASFLME
jgi:hypothetical protein